MAAPFNEQEMHHVIVDKLRQEFRDQFQGVLDPNVGWPACLPAAGGLYSSQLAQSPSPREPLPRNFAWSEEDEAFPPPPAAVAVDPESFAPLKTKKKKAAALKNTKKIKAKAGASSRQSAAAKTAVATKAMPMKVAAAMEGVGSPSRRPAWAVKQHDKPSGGCGAGEIEVDSFGDPLSDQGDFDDEGGHDGEFAVGGSSGDDFEEGGGGRLGDYEEEEQENGDDQGGDDEDDDEEEDSFDDENVSPVSVEQEVHRGKKQGGIRHLKSSVFDAFDPSIDAKAQLPPYRPARKMAPKEQQPSSMSSGDTPRTKSHQPYPQEPDATGLLTVMDEASAAKVSEFELDSATDLYSTSANFKAYLLEHISPGGMVEWEAVMRSPQFKKWLRQRPHYLLSFISRKMEHVSFVLRLYRDTGSADLVRTTALSAKAASAANTPGHGHNHLGHHYAATAAMGGDGGSGSSNVVRFAPNLLQKQQTQSQEGVEVDSFGDPLSDHGGDINGGDDGARAAVGKGAEDFSEFNQEDEEEEDQYFSWPKATTTTASDDGDGGGGNGCGFGPEEWGDPAREALAAKKGYGKKIVPLPGTKGDEDYSEEGDGNGDLGLLHKLTIDGDDGDEEGQEVKAQFRQALRPHKHKEQQHNRRRPRRVVAGKSTAALKADAESLILGSKGKAKVTAASLNRTYTPRQLHHHRKGGSSGEGGHGGVGSSSPGSFPSRLTSPTEASLLKRSVKRQQHQQPASPSDDIGAKSKATGGKPPWVGVQGVKKQQSSPRSDYDHGGDGVRRSTAKGKGRSAAAAVEAAIRSGYEGYDELGGGQPARSKWAAKTTVRTNKGGGAGARSRGGVARHSSLSAAQKSSPIFVNARWGDLKPEVKNSTEYNRSFGWKYM